MVHISIVIPVYNSETSLRQLCSRLAETLSKINPQYEIILVEDCGQDSSWALIESLSAVDHRIKGLKLSRNFGQHYAITAGLDFSIGEWVVVMDADLQDSPEEILKLYQVAIQGFDIVLARRIARKDSFIKRLTSKCFYSLFRFLSGMNYDGTVGNFRIISRKVVSSILLMRENLRFFGGLVEWVGFSISSVDIEHAPRFEGKSSYTVRKLLKLAFETILAYSDRPLRYAVILGFGMAIISFVFGLLILIKALRFGSTVAGWSSLIVSLYFIGGIIITVLGVIGIYLGKTFNETKKRPLYLVDRKVGFKT